MSVSNTTAPAIGYGSTAELQQQVAALSAEIERLNSCLRYEQHRAERVGTHGPGCETWGPAHYSCAVQAIEKLQHSLADRDEDLEKNLGTVVHLSGQLAAAHEREARMRTVLETWMRAFEHAGPKLTIIDFDKLVRAALAEGTPVVRQAPCARHCEATAFQIKIRNLQRQGYELLGVIADVEQGHGFDDVCLGTLKRVAGALLDGAQA